MECWVDQMEYSGGVLAGTTRLRMVPKMCARSSENSGRAQVMSWLRSEGRPMVTDYSM